MKTKEILGILMLFLCTFSFISCDDDKEQDIVRLGQYKIWGSVCNL